MHPSVTNHGHGYIRLRADEFPEVPKRAQVPGAHFPRLLLLVSYLLTNLDRPFPSTFNVAPVSPSITAAASPDVSIPKSPDATLALMSPFRVDGRLVKVRSNSGAMRTSIGVSNGRAIWSAIPETKVRTDWKLSSSPFWRPHMIALPAGIRSLRSLGIGPFTLAIQPAMLLTQLITGWNAAFKPFHRPLMIWTPAL